MRSELENDCTAAGGGGGGGGRDGEDGGCGRPAL